MAILTQMPSIYLNNFYVSRQEQGSFNKYTYNNPSIITQEDLVLGIGAGDNYFAQRFVHGVGPDTSDGSLIVAPYAKAKRTNFDNDTRQGIVDRARLGTDIDRQEFDRLDPNGQAKMLEYTRM